MNKCKKESNPEQRLTFSLHKLPSWCKFNTSEFNTQAMQRIFVGGKGWEKRSSSSVSSSGESDNGPRFQGDT